MDKFGFKVLMFIITGIEIAISISLYFTVKITILYILSILLISACIGGHFSILSPVFNKIFGMERGAEMYGLTGNFIGIASICGPLMTKFVLNDPGDFLVVFLIGGVLCVIKLIVLFFFDENDPFTLNKSSNLIDNKNKNNKEENSDEDNKQITDERITSS
jgi:MFS family permease